MTEIICFSQCSTTCVSKAVVCEILPEVVYVKEPLLLIRKSSPCIGSSGFSFSLYDWSFTICPTQCSHIKNVLSALLNQTFPSFQIIYYLFPYDRPINTVLEMNVD